MKGSGGQNRAFVPPTNHVFQTQSQTVQGNNANTPGRSVSPAPLWCINIFFLQTTLICRERALVRAQPKTRRRRVETADAVEGFHSGGENENEFTEVYET